MANVPVVSWSESTPAGSDNASAGDDRIRELKTQIREVINVDHDFPSSGQAADNGQHKKVTLQEQADLGTGAVSATILGSQTVGGKGELVYTDEDDNDVQITTGGKIKAENLSGVYPAANVAALATMLALIYPVGMIVHLGVSTNPATLWGIGTWTAIAGVVLVGKAASGTFDTLNEALGAETITLTGAQSGVPVHTHPLAYGMETGGGSAYLGSEDGLQAAGATVAPSSVRANTEANAAEAHSNLQPSITKYIWERSA